MARIRSLRRSPAVPAGAAATNPVARWIPQTDERMLDVDAGATARLNASVPVLHSGASIEIEDVDLERL